MAKKDELIKKIGKAESMEELVKIGHAIEKKDKIIDKAIRDKMEALIAETK